MESKQSLAEALRDPAFAREARDYGAGASGQGVEQAGNTNGGNANGDNSTNNMRFREITQDRPNPLAQTYTLATPNPVNATEQSRIQGAVSSDLSFHKDLIKIDRDFKEGLKGKEPGHEQAGQQQGQQQDRQQSREPQGRGR
jgi:hypothetical protein